MSDQACGICASHAPGEARTQLEAWRDEHWVVHHHLDPAPLVGWTFLSALRHVQGPADLTDAEAATFGTTLRRVSRAIRSLTACDRVYAIAFGQGAPHMHVHLIPRYDAQAQTRAWAVADFYRAVEFGRHPAADPIRVRAFVQELRQALAS